MPRNLERTLLKIELTDGRSRSVNVDEDRQPKFDRHGYGGSSSGFGAHTLEISQWPIVEPGYHGEFGVGIAHKSELWSGFHNYSAARYRNLMVRIFDVPPDGVRLGSEVVVDEALELVPGTYADRFGLQPLADRRLIVPLIAGQLVVDFSSLPRFPA